MAQDRPLGPGRSRGLPRSARRLGVALFALLLAGGCGRKGDPIPPGLALPRPPDAPTLSGPGGALTVSWASPREDLAGRPLREGVRYRVLRAAWPPGRDPCEGCPEDLEVAAEVDPVAREARGQPGRAWVDEGARDGWTYRYRVQSVDSAGRAGPPSAVAGISWVRLPAPALEAIPGDGRVAIRAEEPAWPPGVEPLGLRIYGPGGERHRPSEATAGGAVAAGLENGARWEGSARWAARSREGWELEGAGARVSAVPVDTIPPPPPADLVALAAREGVNLHWLPSGAEGYAAVLVLRSEGKGGWEEVATLPGDAVSYLDRSARPGQEYAYQVVALDGAGNRSLPGRDARVRLPPGRELSP